MSIKKSIYAVARDYMIIAAPPSNERSRDVDVKQLSKHVATGSVGASAECSACEWIGRLSYVEDTDQLWIYVRQLLKSYVNAAPGMIWRVGRTYCGMCLRSWPYFICYRDGDIIFTLEYHSPMEVS